jgi:hypothetical protein
VQDEHDAIETVDETLTAGSARLEASRRLLDDIDRRLSRASELLGRGAGHAGGERSAEEPPGR